MREVVYAGGDYWERDSWVIHKKDGFSKDTIGKGFGKEMFQKEIVS